MQLLLIDRLTWVRFVGVLKALSASEVGGRAIALFALLILMLFVISGLNVVNSYVGRDFMTAIANRNMAGFIWQAKIYIGVFAASTAVAVLSRFTEESLGLLWREWHTRQLVTRYLADRTYYRMKETGQVENLDERIADDVRALTVTTLSFVLMLLNGIITVVAFSGVMWSISPLLFGVAIVYAICGTLMSIVLGRRLVGLDSRQMDKEANLRATLIHVRENAESIALSHREERLQFLLLRRIRELADNFRRIIAVNRNLGFFTTGYNYLILIIPALVVAPLFIDGEIEFGVIAQSAMAFAQLVGAFSLIVSQFQSISSFTAVVSRLGSLWEGIEDARSSEVLGLEVVKEDECMAYEHVTLKSAENDTLLINDLSVSIPCGTRLLVVGPSEAAKVALFRATAGIWETGGGRILRPSLEKIFFLPERPYLPPGTLRHVLLRSDREGATADDQIIATLRVLNVESVLTRIGGLDVEQDDWASILSLGEQQLLAFTCLLLAAPRFAFLDRPSTALTPEQVDHILKVLSNQSITYIVVGEDGEIIRNYDAVLELAINGGWSWNPVHEGQVIGAGGNSSKEE
ncbi:ABC transporter ATP-binding protein/permease [Methylococcus sp. EFPC2]|uniref:ABC transporter ATP-binding protein/permease n=1 Tax=Methylococcus sp. EFPC2 TaxID=2812648 RepID=UPI0019682F1D|nr:SbmA/BacA-like family transporter [Methylococcus sp. EFPC2]QSA98508.1 ABC transporter ATP-binding protein/permease [Methylococcus sp. EFPC2]